MVPGGLADHEPQERCQRLDDPGGARAWQLQDRLDAPAQVPQGNGSTGPRSPLGRDRGGRDVRRRPDAGYGRGTRKPIVAVAVEKPTGHVQWGYGRCRLRVIPNAQRETLEDFITDVCEPGSVIYTDGHSAYDRLDALGFTHVISHYSSDDEPAHVTMPAVHRVASLLKRWLLGTHQGSVAGQHLDSYLDEFTFRFNRRRSRSRGLLFYRLMQLAVTTRHTDYETIVWSRRGQMTKLRGRERQGVSRTRA